MMKLDLGTFGNVIDDLLRENKIHMLITLPEGTLEPVVEDNTGLGMIGQEILDGEESNND